MSFLHQELADGKWFLLSLEEQLGNIGSEVGRAISWDKRGDLVQRDRALERALELIDLTAQDKKWHGRLKELFRAREVICDLFYGGNSFNTPSASLEKYFFEFALAARLKR